MAGAVKQSIVLCLQGCEQTTLKKLVENIDQMGVSRSKGQVLRASVCLTLGDLVRAGQAERVGAGIYRWVKQ